GGFVTRVPDDAMTTVPVGLGQGGTIATLPELISVTGVIICGGLVVRNVRGGLFIVIIAMTAIPLIVQALAPSDDWGMATPAIPDSLGGMPDLSIVGQVDLFGAFANIGIIATTLLVFALLLANFFDAMGTFTALGKASGLADEDGVLPD